MSEVIRIDDLLIEVRRSARRRSVDLIVDRFGDLVINVPQSLPHPEVESIIRRKREWIYKKLGQKEITFCPIRKKEYVTGEGFYYLGKKYRLRLLDDGEFGSNIPPLRLLNGSFLMPRSAVSKGRHHFVKWYTRQGQAWISNAVELLKERVLAKPKSIGVRDLKFRWGSCNASGDVYFHWRAILLPPNIIRYLILHELVHLREHNHSPSFYEHLRRAAPNYQETERWLKENGERYTL
jgi:predicted metal-dependent hydrolase